MARKLDRMLIYGSRFSTQALKSSLTTCYFSSFQTDKKLFVYFSITALGAFYHDQTDQYDMACALKVCPLEINSNSGFIGKKLEYYCSTTKNITSPLP